jgi:hypothetical protein
LLVVLILVGTAAVVLKVVGPDLNFVIKEHMLADCPEQITVHSTNILDGEAVAEEVLAAMVMEETKQLHHQHKILDHRQIQALVDQAEMENIHLLMETHIVAVVAVAHQTEFGQRLEE